MHYIFDVQISQKRRLQICTFALVSESQNRTTVFADGLVPLMLLKIEHRTECLELLKKWIEILFLNQSQTFILAFTTIKTQTYCLLTNWKQPRIELNPIVQITVFLTDSMEMKQYVQRRLIYT